MRRRSVVIIAATALLVLVCSPACTASEPLDAATSAAMASVDGQVEDRLAMPPSSSDYATDRDRFVATKEEVVSALNSLDVKAGKLNEAKAAPEPSAHRREVVAAFASIALETLHRATGAIHYLRQRHYAAEQVVKTDHENYKRWIDRNVAATQTQLEHEVAQIGKLRDERSNLEFKIQDAVSKQRAYQVQINQLVSERQLQTQPPLIPSVVAGALTEQQYEAALARLNQYLEKAQQVLKDAQKGVQTRDDLIARGQKWIEDSKAVLERWESHQRDVFNKHVAAASKAELESKRRVEAVERIQADAKRMHKQYLDAIAHMDIQARIKHIKESIKSHQAAKPTDEYEKARIGAFIEALNLEQKGLEAKLAKIAGDGKVVPPPAVWGVLARYSAFAVPVPHIATPSFHPALTPAPTAWHPSMAAHLAVHGPPPAGGGSLDPSISNFVPTMGEANSAVDTTNAATWDHTAAASPVYNPFPAGHPAVGAAAQKQQQQEKAAAPAAKSEAEQAAEKGGDAAAMLEELGRIYTHPEQQSTPQPQMQQQPQQPQQRSGAPAPPVMPDLPQPPRSDFLLV